MQYEQDQIATSSPLRRASWRMLVNTDLAERRASDEIYFRNPGGEAIRGESRL
jgi:hypothetical protein